MKKLIPKCIKRFIKSILQKIIRLQYIILYNHYKKKIPMDDKKILFLSSSREELSGNLLFIYNELKKYDYKIDMELDKNLKVKV